MTSRNTIVYIGDLVRAFEKLQPTDSSTRLAIAEFLGLDWEESPPISPGEVLTQRELGSTTPEATAQASEQETVSADAPPPSQPYTPTTALHRVPVLSTIERSGSEVEPWSIAVQPLRPQTRSEEFTDAPTLEPLFVPLWTRGILTASLSTNSGDGPLDIESIVESLANGEHIGRLPKLSWPTLRRGVQVLIDKSKALTPFTRDQTWLRDEIRRTVGVDKVEVLRFVSCPQRRVGMGSSRSKAAYTCPLPGTPILLLTDLGIGMPMFSADVADVIEWLDFAAIAHQASCPLVAFVPYAPARWPSLLTGVMTVIQWDRETTATTVSNLISYSREGTK